MKIYVGNLSFQTEQQGIQELFSQHGTLGEVAMVTDRETGRSRGFAFVTMSDDTQARAAIAALNGKELDGRALTVNEARPKPAGGGGFRGGSSDGSRNRW